MSFKILFFTIPLLSLFTACSSLKNVTHKNKYNWFDFYWEADSISGQYFPKMAMLVPTKINDLNVNFELQFDLGANTSILYGNTLKSYYSESKIKNWLIDSTKFSPNEQISYYVTKGINVQTGNFKIENITYMENYGNIIPKDSLLTKTAKHIGSLGADAFKNKILIIDFPNEKMCVLDTLDDYWKSKAIFVQTQSKRGRIHIPFKINNKTYWFLFDTGASLFPINTNKKLWTEIVEENVKTDTIISNSWGEKVNFYGRPIEKDIYIGDKKLDKNYAWYNENKRLMEFNEVENIDGLTGNAYFFNDTIVLDFKSNKFGIVK